MANLDQLGLPNGSTYNFKDNTQERSNHRHYEADVTPLVHKTYASTSYYATSANDWNTSTWYFMSIKPDSWYKPWTVRFKIHSICPSYSSYESLTYATISGRSDGYIFANWNERQNTAHYYTTIYTLKQAGFNAGYGHAVGISILYGDNYTNSAYYRTFEVDYYYCENCTVTILDIPVKWADWSGTGTTNYNGLNSMNAVSRGLMESGDDNTYTVLARAYPSIKAGSNKIYPYTFFMQNADGRWESIVTSSSTATGKSRNTHGFRLGQICYLSSGSTYSENAVPGWGQARDYHTDLIDHRYSFNTENNSTNGTTANAPVYLVGSMGNDGLFYLDTKWWTQTLPTSADGKLYIYLGDAYDYYRMTFVENRRIYRYINGMIRDYAQDAGTVNGLTVEKAVPSNAVFTDNNTTYTFANGTNGFTVTPSGGSAQTVTVTPSITNNVTGSGTSGYIAKFNGANTITNGPAFGLATNTFLRNDGQWASPAAGSDTTYTIGTSGNNITLTPSSGSVQSITAPYATSAGSAASATTASKLGSSNVGSATNPIYLNGGTATACTYSLNKTVPSDAVFTDTTYSSLPAASGGTSLSLVTTGEKYTWNNKSLGDLSNVVVTNPNGGDILQYSYAEGNWVNGKITDMWVDGIYPVGAVFHVDTRTIPTGSHITLSQLNYSNLLGAPSNLPGESGGTDMSLVTTGEKYTWNNGCTDTKVTQTADTTNAYFPVLLAGTADSTTRTEGTKKSGELVFNPNAKELHVQKVVSELFVAEKSDHTSATTISNDQSVFMGDVVVVGSLSCNNISLGVEDISEDYIPSKTSGNWSIGSDDGVYRIKAYRMGNLVQMTIGFHGNGSAVSSGSNGFIGAITGGALPVSQITLNGFYSSSILAATLDTDGSITVRPFSASCTLSSASRAYLTGTFICE